MKSFKAQILSVTKFGRDVFFFLLAALIGTILLIYQVGSGIVIAWNFQLDEFSRFLSIWVIYKVCTDLIIGVGLIVSFLEHSKKDTKG